MSQVERLADAYRRAHEACSTTTTDVMQAPPTPGTPDYDRVVRAWHAAVDAEMRAREALVAYAATLGAGAEVG